MQSVGVYAGISHSTKNCALDWRYIMHSKWKLRIGLGMNVAKGKERFCVFTHPLISYLCYTDHCNCHLDILAGPIFMFMKKSEENEYDVTQGITAGLSTIFFIFSSWAICCDVGPCYLFKKKPFKNHVGYFARLGLKFVF